MDVAVVDSGHSVRWTERAYSNSLTTTVLRVTDTEGVEGIGGWDSYTTLPAPGERENRRGNV